MTEEPRRRRWWLEPEFGLLLLLVVGIYFTRLNDLTIRGEESRRATVARQMSQTGDWIVPRQQGEPYITRPPLQSWAIALVGKVRGDVDTLAIRLPSAISVLLTAVVIYGYGRSFLTPLGALAAGAVFATFGQVQELGPLGESDAMLTLFVTSSILVWHGGWARRWPALWCWVPAYALAALGLLTKGPQTPAYFAGSVGVYLLVTRQWRALLTWTHLAGIATFALVLGVWLVPFLMKTGIGGLGLILGHEVTVRMNHGTMDFFVHLVTYPVELLFGGLLPWSIMLLAFLDRRFRASIGDVRDHVVFLVGAIAITLPTCWLPPGAETRLYISLFPVLALLIGLAIDRSWAPTIDVPWRKVWDVNVIVITVAAAGVALASVSTMWLDRSVSALLQPPAFAIGFVVAVAVGIVLMLRSRNWPAAQAGRTCVVVLSVLSALVCTGAIVNVKVARSNDLAGAVARLKAALPPDARLASFGRIHHGFSYHFRDPIELLPWPVRPDDLPEHVTHFCFNDVDLVKPLPMDWQEIAVLSCDRSRRPDPSVRVIVGRRQ